MNTVTGPNRPCRLGTLTVRGAQSHEENSPCRLGRPWPPGSCWRSAAAVLWPWTNGRWRRRAGSEPKSQHAGRDRMTSPIVRRSRWRSRPTARASWPPTRPPGPCRWSIPSPGECSTSSRPATSPSGVALSKDGRRGVVTHWYGYDLGVLEIKDDKIVLAGRVEVGPEPRGVALSADGSTAYVAIGVNNEVARVDLNGSQGDRPAAGRPGTARDCPHARRVAPAGE